MKFELNELEVKRFDKWKKHQLKKQGGEIGMAGGRFGLKFFPTGIGSVVYAIDSLNEEELDITDYDSW